MQGRGQLDSFIDGYDCDFLLQNLVICKRRSKHVDVWISHLRAITTRVSRDNQQRHVEPVSRQYVPSYCDTLYYCERHVVPVSRQYVPSYCDTLYYCEVSRRRVLKGHVEPVSRQYVPSYCDTLLLRGIQKTRTEGVSRDNQQRHVVPVSRQYVPSYCDTLYYCERHVEPVSRQYVPSYCDTLFYCEVSRRRVLKGSHLGVAPSRRLPPHFTDERPAYDAVIEEMTPPPALHGFPRSPLTHYSRIHGFVLTNCAAPSHRSADGLVFHTQTIPGQGQVTGLIGLLFLR
ncbi:hypothetical protein J6590_097754 [Homalodisca vitripennis]|nr:hypothetical protein J6590_097754 [Homalodisca vitripennis]